MELDLVENEKVLVVKSKTASHNVDPENGFTPLCPEELPVPEGHLIVEELKGQNEIAGVKTVSKDMHPANAIHIATKEHPQYSPILNEKNVDKYWNAHCLSGTFGSKLIEGLGEMTDYNYIVYKGCEPNLHPYSSCYQDQEKKISTGLIEWYNAKGITTVIVGGLALNFEEETPLCVGETVIDLVNAGFQVILNLGATRGLGSEEGKDKFVTMLINDYNVIVVNSYKDIESIE